MTALKLEHQLLNRLPYENSKVYWEIRNSGIFFDSVFIVVIGTWGYVMGIEMSALPG